MNNLREGGFLISKINQLSGRIFSRKLKNDNLSEINAAQGRILFSLWDSDSIPISEVSKRTALKKSTLTSMLDRLEKNGFIKREYPQNDRRKTIISLTEKDSELKDVYKKVSNEMAAIFYQGFSEEEIVRFEKYLKRILNNLENNE